MLRLPDDARILRLALTHPSYANENGGGEDNQRLEFLGDAVLGLFVGELLYLELPGMPEGELSQRRASLVCEESLARLAVEIGIGQRLLLGRSELMSGGREKPSLLADTFEAVIGAHYLELGPAQARDLVREVFEPLLGDAQRGGMRQARSRLHEIAQSRGLSVEFELVERTGPDHRPNFTMAAILDGQEAGRGTAHSKQDAAAIAAAAALRTLEARGDERSL